MASTIRVDATISVTGTEVLDTTTFPAAGTTTARTLITNAYNATVALTATSTPSVDLAPLQQVVTITGGSVTIDLTAAPIGDGRTQDFTGKKLVGYIISVPIGNADGVNVKPGGSNGYDFLLIAAAGQGMVKGQTVATIISGASSGMPAVSATAKNITITGTNDDIVNIVMWFGT